MALNGVIEQTVFTDGASISSGSSVVVKAIHVDELNTAITSLQGYLVNVDNCGNCTFCQTCQGTTCQSCQTCQGCQSCQGVTCQSISCQKCEWDCSGSGINTTQCSQCSQCA